MTPPAAAPGSAAIPERPYLPGREIARGGMGAVLDARDQKLGRSVAMKVMLRPHASLEEKQRFLQEARVLGQLAHPNIVPVHDLGTNEQGRLYYTMKLVQGVTLHDVLLKLKRGDQETLAKYPLHQLLNVFQKVCDAMAFAHSRGVIHRDLKPENIMLGDFGEVLVMDWGLAKLLDAGAASVAHIPPLAGLAEVAAPATEMTVIRANAGFPTTPELLPAANAPDAATLASEAPAPPADSVTLVMDSAAAPDSVTLAPAMLTMEGAVMGTPAFMAPEQAAGRVRELDARSDVYALGGILYGLLTLRQPVHGGSLSEITSRILSGDIRPPLSYNAAGAAAARGTRGAAAPARGTRGRPHVAPRADGAPALPPVRHIPLAHCPDGRVPEALSAVTMKAMALRPEDRYPSVVALRSEIDSFQAGFATAAERAGFFRQLTLLVRRRKAEAAVLAASVLVLLVVVAGFVMRLGHQRNLAVGTLKRLEGTAPTFHEQSRVLAEDGRLEEALAKIDYALSLAPGAAAYHEQKGNLLQTLLRLDEAVASYDRALKLDPASAAAAGNRALCRELARAHAGQEEWSVAHLQRLHAALLQQQRAGEARVIAEGWRSLEAPVQALLETWRAALARGGIPVRTLDVDRAGRFTLKCKPAPISSLAALKGMPLRVLDLAGTRVADLRPLEGAPLENLTLTQTEVADLAPLRGMPLTHLVASSTPLSDLTPLRGLALTNLVLYETRVTDLSPLRGMPLTGFHIKSAALTDLEPLRGMPLRNITVQFCSVSNISVLAGMKLDYLNLRGTAVADLAPLRGMRTLGTLSLGKTYVADLSPLGGLAVTNLTVEAAAVHDLTPLTGMKLVRFICTRSNLENIAALRDMPLEYLELSKQAIRDISVLRDMPLKELRLDGCGRLKDISALASLTQLEKLALPQGAKQVESLRSLPRLKWLQASDSADIELTPAADFWKEHDAKKTPR